MQELSTTIERVHAVTKYSKYYKEYNASLPDKAFFKSTKLRLPYMKMLSQSLKNLIPSSQIQRIFQLSLINYKKKRIALCKSILPQNPLWTSFIRYEKITEFIWIRRWRDNLCLLFSQIKKESVQSQDHTDHKFISQLLLMFLSFLQAFPYLQPDIS